MYFKKNFSRSITAVVLLILLFILFNFFTNKQEALALTKDSKHKKFGAC